MDISQFFGGDLIASSNGDLQTVDGVDWSQQRILRRLLTNPGDYIWRPTYGAGLQRYIGQALSLAKYQEIEGLIRSQIFLETSVSKTPAPVINLSATQTELFCSIQYTEANTKTLQVLTFSASNSQSN